MTKATPQANTTLPQSTATYIKLYIKPKGSDYIYAGSIQGNHSIQAQSLAAQLFVVRLPELFESKRIICIH